MAKIHKCDNIADELHKLYPDGLVLGECMGIIGQFGLNISWIMPNGKRQECRYREDEQLPIIEIRGNMLILGEFTPPAIVHHNHFKGFKKYKI